LRSSMTQNRSLRRGGLWPPFCTLRPHFEKKRNSRGIFQKKCSREIFKRCSLQSLGTNIPTEKYQTNRPVLSAGNQVASIGMVTTLDFCYFLCLTSSLCFTHFFYCSKKRRCPAVYFFASATSANSNHLSHGKDLELCLFCASSSLCFSHYCSKKEVSSCLFRVSRRQHRTKKNSADVSFFLVSNICCSLSTTSPHSVPPTHKHPTSP